MKSKKEYEIGDCIYYDGSATSVVPDFGYVINKRPGDWSDFEYQLEWICSDERGWYDLKREYFIYIPNDL